MQTATMILVSLLASTQAEESWSVGAGAGLTLSPLAGVGVVGGLAGATPLSTRFALSIERKLAPRLWLMALGDGSFSASSVADDTASGYGWGLGLGLRVVAARIDAFEMAPYLGVWFRQNRSSFDPVDPGTAGSSSASMGAAADVGLAFQYRLVPGLYVRLATSLASASWSRFDIEVEGQDDASVTSFGGEVHVSPSLELRMFF